MSKVKKLVYLSLIISLALVIHYFESFIPPLAPGAKLGLANIMALVTLSLFGFKEALVVTLIRSLLGPLIGGSPSSILYSLAGGILATLIMALLYQKFRPYFTLMGISTAGAVSQPRPATCSLKPVWDLWYNVYLPTYPDAIIGNNGLLCRPCFKIYNKLFCNKKGFNNLVFICRKREKHL